MYNLSIGVFSLLSFVLVYKLSSFMSVGQPFGALTVVVPVVYGAASVCL